MTDLEHAQAMRLLARAYHGRSFNIVPLGGDKRPVITGAATNGKPFRFRWSDWLCKKQQAVQGSGLRSWWSPSMRHRHSG